MTDKATKQIARNLKKARRQQGLTQVELAKKAGIHSNHYAKIERGEVKPSIELVEKIIKALKAKSSDIFPF